MKNNNFKRKIELKTLLDDASSDHIESFIEKNKNSSISDDMLKNIKAKTFEKTGIKTACEKETTKKKDKKIPMRRWFYAAACLLLAFAVVIAAKHINFGNNPPAVSGDESNAISQGTDESNEVSAGTESVDNSNESQPPSQDEPFEIKGINWADESGETDRVNLIQDIKHLLWNSDAPQYTWAKVVLNKITPLGAYEKENKYLLYQSVVEIEIVSVYNPSDAAVSVNEGDTLQIVVDWLVEDGKIFLSQYNEMHKEKRIYCIPMTEIGKEYVLSFYGIGNKEVLKVLEEKYPEVDTRLGSLTSYPLFSADFSEIKGLNEYKISAIWPCMYATIYNWYMKDNVSKESNEYKLYKFFNAGIIPPENPRSVKSETK